MKLSDASLMYIISIVVAGYIIILQRQQPNVFQIDFAGHITSMVNFAESGLHGFSQGWYHGIINNLLYPPLQDIIASIIYKITHTTPLYAFMIYQTLVISGFFLALAWMVSGFTKKSTKRITYGSLMMVFFADKIDNISTFQGVGLVDNRYTGLTSQLLGAIFFLLFIGSIIRQQNRRYYTLFSILSLLSHLVIGPITIMIISGLYLRRRKQEYIISIVIILTATAFFWLPFASFKALGSSATIIHTFPWSIFVGGLLTIVYLFWIKSDYVVIPGAGLLLILPGIAENIRGSTINLNEILPSFHYYRFHIMCVILFLIGGGYVIDSWDKNSSNLNKICIIIISFFLIGSIYTTLGIVNISTIQEKIGDRPPIEQGDIERLSLYTSGKGKIFTIDIYRPIDFGLDAQIRTLDKNISFVKGLFRESHRSNQLLSSFIANLLYPQNIVLNYITFPVLTKYDYHHLRDAFIDAYNIKRLLVAPINQITYGNDFFGTKINELLTGGTAQYNIDPIETIKLGDISYILYKITNKTITRNIYTIGNIDIEVLDQRSGGIYDTYNAFFSKEIFEGYLKSNKSGIRNIIFDKSKKDEYNTFVSNSSTIGGCPNISFTIEKGMINGSTHGGDCVVSIHIPDYPFWSIEGDVSGSVEGLHETLLHVTGKFTVTYRRTKIVISAYIVSLMGVVTYLGLLIPYVKSYYPMLQRRKKN